MIKVRKQYWAKPATSQEDILSLLLSQQQTARFITKKIYRYFVNEEVDEARVDELSKKFYQSNYNISELMVSIFSSDWFYDAKNIGNKIKSPIELLAGMQRVLPMEWKKTWTVTIITKTTGTDFILSSKCSRLARREKLD